MRLDFMQNSRYTHGRRPQVFGSSERNSSKHEGRTIANRYIARHTRDTSMLGGGKRTDTTYADLSEQAAGSFSSLEKSAFRNIMNGPGMSNVIFHPVRRSSQSGTSAEGRRGVISGPATLSFWGSLDETACRAEQIGKTLVPSRILSTHRQRSQ